MNEHALRKELVRYAHLLYERTYLVAMDGNLSVRLPGGHILCTRAGVHKGFLTEDDLIVVDGKGRKVRGQGQPTSELAMHVACYEERADVTAVLHAHPPHAIAFTLANRSLERPILPEVVLTLGTVPTVPYETTGTTALADAIRGFVKERDVVMMDRHGAVALGRDLLDAFCKLETLEHTARIIGLASALGGVKELPREESVRLRSMGLRRYGGPPAAVAKADAPLADLPPRVLDSADSPFPDPITLAPRGGGLDPDGMGPEVRAMARAIHREVESVLHRR